MLKTLFKSSVTLLFIFSLSANAMTLSSYEMLNTLSSSTDTHAANLAKTTLDSYLFGLAQGHMVAIANDEVANRENKNYIKNICSPLTTVMDDRFAKSTIDKILSKRQFNPDTEISLIYNVALVDLYPCK